MIYLGYKSLSKLEGLNSIRICICLGVIAVMTWIAIMGKYPTIKDRYAYLDLIAVSIFALSLIFHNKQKASWVIKMATLLQIVMVLFNAVLTIRQMLPGLTHHTYKYYAEFLDSVEPAVDYVKRNDSSFYRMEKDFRYRGSDNDPMLLDYNGISHFSSTYDQNSLDFVRKLGFMQIMARASFGEGGSEGGNDLLGIKYFLSRESPPNQDDYELIECINGVNIWENKDVLGIATLSDSISDLNGILNPFEFQNSYINMLSSNSSNVYLPVTIEEISYNSLEKYGQDMLHNVTESSKVEYVFHVERKEPIYIYINQNNWKILLNGEPFETQSPYSQIIYLGEFDIGQKVTISLQPPATNGTSECVDAELSIYYENSELLNSIIANKRNQSGELIKLNDTSLEGFIEINDVGKYLLFTIPYDDTWQATVDGKNVEILKAADSLMAIEIPAGNHKYCLEYKPKRILYSNAVSIISILVLSLYYAKRKIASVSLNNNIKAG